jgi:DUF2971 family protein
MNSRVLLSEYDQSAVKLAAAANKRILDFYNAQQGPLRTEQLPPKGVLYHYTTAQGLIGIIENNELWATSAYYLNDSSEIIYGYGVLKEALDSWIAENPRPEESLALGLARDLRQSFGEDLLNMNVVTPIYLACFCTEDNLLSQWRVYSLSGGYSLGMRFPISPFDRKKFRPEADNYTARWVRVEYERTEQVKLCRGILNFMLAIFDEPTTAEAIIAIESHPVLGYSKLRASIGDILMEEIVAFKNKAFEMENEWRVVVRRRELMKQGTDDGGKTRPPTYFRSSDGMLVPYVKLIPIEEGGKLAVASIQSGPMLDKTTALMAVSQLLDKNGFSGVRLLGSDIPARFNRNR